MLHLGGDLTYGLAGTWEEQEDSELDEEHSANGSSELDGEESID